MIKTIRPILFSLFAMSLLSLAACNKICSRNPDTQNQSIKEMDDKLTRALEGSASRVQRLAELDLKITKLELENKGLKMRLEKLEKRNKK